MSAIAIVVFLAVTFGVYYGLYRWGKLNPPALIGERSGVAGWLLLLAGGFVYSGPLVAGSKLSSMFRNAEILHPNVLGVPAWHHFKIATWSVYAVTTCISVYGGVVLVRLRTPSAVQTAKAVLWLAGPIAGLVQGIAVPWFVFHKVLDIGMSLGVLTVSCISTILWIAYLSKSKRVKTTYGV